MHWRIHRNLNPHARIRFTVVWIIIDSLIIFSAYTVSFFARAFTTPLTYVHSIGAIAAATLITIGAFYLTRIYRRIWSQTSGHGVTNIVGGVALSTAIIGCYTILLHPRPLPLSVVIIGGMLTLTGTVASRYRSRLIPAITWRWNAIWNREFPDPPTQLLIVGAGEAGQALAWRIKHRWSSTNNGKYCVVGFIDDDADKLARDVEGCPVLGGRQDIPRIVEIFKVELIVLAIHNISGQELRNILDYCQQTDARIKIVPDLLEFVSDNSSNHLLRDIKPEEILGRNPIGRHPDVDFSAVSHKTVVVTGAAGSIGSELCRQLLAFEPTKLVILDNNETALNDLLIDLCPKNPGTILAPALVDVTDTRTVEELFAQHKPQVVFHAAAYKHVPMMQLFPTEAVRVNVFGTMNVARAALQTNVERFIVIPTDKAVNPECIMGTTKRMCEILVQQMGLEDKSVTLFTSVRFGNVLGSRGSVVPIFNRQIESGGPVTVTDPEMARFFMTISEAVNLVIHAACLTRGGDIFMLRMGELVSIVQLAERMIRLRGLRPYEDIKIEFTGKRPGEKLTEQLSYETEKIIPTVHPNVVQLVERHGLPHAQNYQVQLNALRSYCTASSFEFGLDARVEASNSGTRFIHANHDCQVCLSQFVARLEHSTAGHTLPQVRCRRAPRGFAVDLRPRVPDYEESQRTGD